MSVKQTVIRAALAKWMQDRIKGVRDQLAAEAKDAMDVGDRKKAVLDDGTVIGSVTITDPKWLPKVVDMEALFEWVQENAPHNIEQPAPPPPRVYPSYVDALLKTVVFPSTDTSTPLPRAAIDPKTGEVIPGIMFERRPPNATVTVNAEQGAAIQAALADGRLDDYMRALNTDPPKELEA